MPSLRPLVSLEDDQPKDAATTTYHEIQLQAALKVCNEQEHPLLKLYAEMITGGYVDDLKAIWEQTKCEYRHLVFRRLQLFGQLHMTVIGLCLQEGLRQA